MLDYIDKNLLQDVYNSAEFKGWLISRRWFGDKSMLSNLEFNIKIDYYSTLAGIIFLSIIKIEKPDYSKSYFLPMIYYKKLQEILEPNENIREKIVKLTEITFSKKVVITTGTEEKIFTLNLIEAEYTLKFWKKILFDKEIAEKFPSFSLNLTLYDEQFQDKISMDEVQNLIEAGLFPKRYEFALKQLGGGNTTNSIFLLRLKNKEQPDHKKISYILKSYKECVENMEPAMLYVLVKNYFPNAPKIYGTIKINGIETIGIIENVQNIGNIGDIVWNEVNKMIFDVFQDLNADYSKFKDKTEVANQIKKYFSESIKAFDEIPAYINNLHKALILKNNDEYSLENVDSKTYLNNYTAKLNSMISNLQDNIKESTKKAFYNLPKINSILIDLKDIIEKFRAEFKETSIKIQHVHQDLHMEQILYNKTRDGQHFNFYFIDFEGDPQLTIDEKKGKFPIEKDIASFLRALSYIKYNTFLNFIEKKILQREQYVVPEEILYSISFRKSARGREKDKILKRVLDVLNVWEDKLMTKLIKSLKPNITLTNYFSIERALYELNYELLFRPSKMIVPILGLKEITEKN